MRQISLVGAVDEEVGDYFPEFLDMLEESPFLKVRKCWKRPYGESVSQCKWCCVMSRLAEGVSNILVSSK